MAVNLLGGKPEHYSGEVYRQNSVSPSKTWRSLTHCPNAMRCKVPAANARCGLTSVMESSSLHVRSSGQLTDCLVHSVCIVSTPEADYSFPLIFYYELLKTKNVTRSQAVATTADRNASHHLWRSYDVIIHVTIWEPICHFVLVVLWNGVLHLQPFSRYCALRVLAETQTVVIWHTVIVTTFHSASLARPSIKASWAVLLSLCFSSCLHSSVVVDSLVIHAIVLSWTVRK